MGENNNDALNKDVEVRELIENSISEASGVNDGNLNDINEKENFIPVLPLKWFVMFPGLLLNLELTKRKSIYAVNEAMNTDQRIFIVSHKNVLSDDSTSKNLCTVGIVASLKEIIRQPNSPVIKVFAEGIKRAKVVSYIEDSSCIKAKLSYCDEIIPNKTKEIDALIRKARELFSQYLSFLPKVSADLLISANLIDDPGRLSDYICANIAVPLQEKQKLLEEFDTKKRIKKLLKVLAAEIDISELEEKIAFKLKNSIDKNQKEYFLKEQMKIISEELGEEDDPQEEALKYKNKIKKLKLKKEISEKLINECNRFSRIPPGSIEANLARDHIEMCLSLPWNKKTKDKIDLKKARSVLDEQHFGLDEVKDRIIEILAVKKLSKSLKGQIICLDGPPGVGKTSITKAIADAMGRKFERLSLGGIKDEAEIRGHRRTYVGAMPGRIISAVKQSGVKNPLILLDEIDKLSNDYHGDPSSALLETLDPEQNHSFYDHYIDLPFDLSEVLFITTANDKNKIPRPLFDRMEIISLYSYTHEEKFNIARRHLIKKQLDKNGLKEDQFSISDEALHCLIESYTREAGVRGLEKKIASLMRRTAKGIASGDIEFADINTDMLEKMLGPKKYKNAKRYENSEVGVVKGLAWTEVGGETMPIEVALMKGKGKVQITGSLGDVMKESAQIAVSYIRSNADKVVINKDFYDKTDIHIHAPEGAIPKDGPSAGVTMTTALVSALSGVPVRQDVAMTGEVTLKGKVLEIGGLKEKTMAAYRDGVRTVIIPSENESDLEKIDKKVRKSLNFVMADSLDTVFKHSLDKRCKPI